MRGRLAEEAAVALLALQFLTRLPLPAPYSPARMAAVARWFPAVGALVGALGAAVWWAAAALWPPAVAALLAVAALVLLTGAFHEDGLADSFDGLGAADPARRLEIMRDSRLGSFGALALLLVTALRVTALALMPPALVPWALVAAEAGGRAAAVALVATAPYARDEGMAKPVARGIGPGGLAFALGTGLAALAPLALLGGAGAAVASLLGLALGHGAVRIGPMRGLGGYTGDILGAAQQLAAVGLLLGVLAWAG